MKIDLKLQKGGFTLNAKAHWPDKDMTVIAGPSGAGKTSLLRACVGLDRAHGDVVFAAQAMQDRQSFVPVAQRRMAWVSQHDDVFAHLSVAQNFAFAMRFAAPGGAMIEDVASHFGLADRMGQNAGALSGGEKQRLILARALLSNPRLLALDEPFGALDAEARHALLGLLTGFCKARTLPVLFVSHDLDTLTRLADFMVYMRGGRIVAQGPLNACLLDEELPFRRREDACVVLPAIAQGYDAANQLNALDVGGVRLLVPGAKMPKGEGQRLRLRAGDISLSRARHGDSSVLNILPVVVRGVEQASDNGLPPGLVNVALALGEQSVLARITAKSAMELQLAPGEELFAQIKASALVGG